METADLIIYSNAIFDSVSDEPFSGGIAISGKKIMAVGTKEEISKLAGPDTMIKDMGEKLVLPGFCESHGHFISGAEYYSEVACHDMECCNSEQDCVEMISSFAKKHPEQERYIGQGWFLSYWGENAKFPTKDSLDRAIPDKPVYLSSSDLHTLWMNSKAIEESHLKEYLEEFDENHILRDENGEPTGIVREVGKYFDYHEDKSFEQIKKEQLTLIHALNASGFTAFSEMSAIKPDDLASTFQYLKSIEDDGDLTLRMYLYPGVEYDCSLIPKVIPYKHFFNTDELKICGLKSFMDGVTATYTALLNEPYADRPDTKGVAVTTVEKLNEYVTKANKAGFSCRIHCIGDGAVREALDAFELSNASNDNTNIRNSVEHIEVTTKEDIPRFHELNVTASMQPWHQILDKGEKLIRVGLERSRYEWPFRSILDTGGHLALGSDYPVVNYNPFYEIYFGMTTKSLDGEQYGQTSRSEVITLPEALKSYTIEGARVNRMDSRTGTLTPGKYADITVVDRNLFTIPVDEIKECHTYMTVMNGKIVYDAENE